MEANMHESLYLYMNVGTSGHATEFKAYWLSCLHIGNPTYLNHSLFRDECISSYG